MKFVDDFSDPEAVKVLIKRIEHQAANFTEPLRVMEICGGHTHTIYRHGLEHLLPEQI